MFIRPCEGRLTSPFGMRTHQGVKSLHQGIDVALAGTVPIYAAASGEVSRVYKDGAFGTYGNVVFIKHVINGKNYETVYAHLRSYSVKVGQKVISGQQIGIMGNTDGGSGRSTGQHLHFEINIPNWNQKLNSVDPLNYISLVPSLGTKGADVTDLQKKLIQLEYMKSASGIFDNGTDIAVKAFQKSQGLKMDGYAGPDTMAKLNVVIAALNKPVPAPPPIKEEKKGDEKLELSKEQRQELALIFKKAREKGIFTTDRHEKSIIAGTMTTSYLQYLQSIIAGAALNGGKRIK